MTSENAKKLKELRARAIGLRELARAIGWDPSRYQYYEDQYKKQYLPLDLIERIRPHIEGKGTPAVTAEDLAALAGLPSGAAALPEKTASYVQFPVASNPVLRPRSSMPRDIPIVGTVSGGTGGVQMFNGEPVDWARRPPRLEGRTDIFGLYVEDLSMVPAYRPGSLILVERARPPAPGDDVVIELLPAGPKDERRALIKRLVALTPKTVRLEQYNPPKELEFPRKQIAHLYRVMQLADLLGV